MSLNIDGLDFGPASDAAGVRNFDGKGWVHHGVFPGMFQPPSDFLARDDPDGPPWCSFVSKTVTAEPLVGFMPLQEDGITPKEWLPRCIVPGPLTAVRPMVNGVGVNSVGLSNRGIQFYLSNGTFEGRKEPWRLSVMTVKPGREDWIKETEQIRDAVAWVKNRLGPFALEDNESCPNTGVDHDPRELIETVETKTGILAALGVPILVKVVCTITPRQGVALMELPHVAGLVTTNTFPWGTYADVIDYEQLFGTKESPLKNLDPKNPNPKRGGLSGWPLRKFNAEWIASVRKLGGKKPINASGGVNGEEAVRIYKAAGASSIAIGSVAITRPWRVRGIIRAAHREFAR